MGFTHASGSKNMGIGIRGKSKVMSYSEEKSLVDEREKKFEVSAVQMECPYRAEQAVNIY